jgi:DNA-binding SARP family transcriptional activator/ABC-type branched-subunit amino acid transport system substrate-binding protein/DNA-binding beta-propeller fold protein YncE
MDFRVLGPLEVSEEGRLVDLGGPTQRALLAVLLLNASEVVSMDRLIDELWGDEPPATAVKSLRGHVSRLRRALNGAENGRLETRGHGYVLHVRPGELDADRFRELLEDARRRVAGGDADGAAETLNKALAMWRGPALADMARNRLARSEIAHLDELRFAAIEERIEADLARGRHAALVPELERLVVQHPLRERLRGQLMLALYRADRQAEALGVYQDGRRALAEDLGLEPSQGLRRLERQILEQDPAIAPPRAARRVAIAPRRRIVPIRAVAAGLAVVAVAAAAVVLLVGDGDGDTAAALERAGAYVLDPGTGTLQATIPLGRAPAQIVTGEGAVWALDADDRTISRIDPHDRANVRTFSTASTPTDVAAGAGALWVGNASRTSRFASFPTSVSRLDPESGVVDATIPLPGGESGPYFHGGGQSQSKVAVSTDAVWAVNPDRTVSRIDPRTNRRVARIEGVSADSVAAGREGVWVVDASADPFGASPGVARIDPRTNRVARRVEISAESLSAVAVGAGSVWVADPLGGSVWRVNPVPEPVLRQVPLELGVRGIAFGAGRVWVTNEVAGTVHAIDPRTNRARVVARLAAPQHVAVGAGGVWLTALGAPSADATLPAATCRSVFFRGGGSPRLLVVSDLPLQGDARAAVTPMVEGIRFVLQRRGFRAGRHRVGYGSCDDSTAQAGGTDVSRCFGNAKLYARTPDVVGVIGAFHSFCSELEIPIAGQASDGPLAMISPSNSFTGLTRPYRGMARGELERLYPTGERNFVRIAAADHLAPVALVQAAEELGRTRVFVLWDREDPYMAGFADDMRAAARTLGLDVVGAAGWDPGARDFARLAGRVAAARPEAVLMAGAAPPAAPALLRDLRAHLGDRPALIASDGFADFERLRESGRAAQGMYVANYGVPNAELPPAGRRLLDAARRPEDDPDFSFAYGAQAAEILLDAVARSDGTRASVTRTLRRTRVEDGILGDIRFDRYGDPVEAPVTIYRMTRGGAVVDRVVQVSRASGR